MDEETIEGQEPEDGGLVTKDKINDAMIKSMAAMAAAGANRSAIQKHFKVSMRQVNNVFKMDAFKDYLKKIGEDAIVEAKAVTRQELSKLAKEAVRVIGANLKKDNLNAAQLVLKAIGLDGSQKEENTQQGFTLVLANQKKEEVIKVIDNREDDDA